MTRRRLSVKQLAAEAGMDVDETLITLWDNGFTTVSGPQHSLPKRDSNRARRALGLATRRELETKGYWTKALGLASERDVDALLRELEVPKPTVGKRLTARAIRRLASELRRRETVRRDQKPVRIQPTPQYEPFRWRVIGRETDVRLLTVDQVCAVHGRLVDDFKNTADPLDPPGVRSTQLLESAVGRPGTAIGQRRKYPTVEMAAAALMHSLVHDHPFHNGNKRTALVAMLVMLDGNGLILTCAEDELFRVVLQLAQHALARGPRAELPDREVLAVAEWLACDARPVVKGDRPVAWRRLRRLLVRYGCEFENPTAGNRINIARKVHRPGGLLFRSARTHVLHTQTAYAGEGTEAARNTVNKIRRALELDEEHGVDSASFYENQAASESEFIHQYKRTLRRLAKL